MKKYLTVAVVLGIDFFFLKQSLLHHMILLSGDSPVQILTDAR